METNREIGVAMGILNANGQLTEPSGVRPVPHHRPEPQTQLRDIAADVALTGQLPRVTLKLLGK